MLSEEDYFDGDVEDCPSNNEIIVNFEKKRIKQRKNSKNCYYKKQKLKSNILVDHPIINLEKESLLFNCEEQFDNSMKYNYDSNNKSISDSDGLYFFS